MRNEADKTSGLMTSTYGYRNEQGPFPLLTYAFLIGLRCGTSRMDVKGKGKDPQEEQCRNKALLP